MDSSRNIIGLIPFYADCDSTDYNTKVSLLLETENKVRQYANKTVVICDGLCKDVAERLNCDLLLNLPQHSGKAEAVRTGLREILKQSWDFQYIVQIDADGDYPAENIPYLLNMADKLNCEVSSSVLVIGDRYPEDPHEINEFRRNILILQELFGESLGFKIRDIVAGLRLYNLPYTQHFLKLSRSQGFGLEFEQLLIAHHIGAHVAATHMQGCRTRDESTQASKLLMNFMVVFNFISDLHEKGLDNFVRLFQFIIAEMEAGHKMFVIDLSIFGKNKSMYFEKIGCDRYTIHSLP